MASPKGRYTPKSGLFSGQTFRSYFAYQQARSQALGFANYSAERKATTDPAFRMLEARLRALGASRNDARRQVAGFNPRGKSKSNVVAWSVENGLYDTGDEAALEYYGSIGE